MRSLKEEKLYIKVVEEIKKEIMDGNLKRGEKLPPEREIAETLQVSRASVREAMRALEVGGLIESKHGSGNFIRNDFERSLMEPLSLIFLLNGSNKRAIHEIRSTLEIQAALMANEKINDDEIKKLETLVEKLRNSTNEDINKELDKEFHYTIINAADNLFLNIFLSTISSLIDKFIKEAREEIFMSGHSKEKLNGIHQKIVTALKEKNEQMLYEAMRSHSDLVLEGIKSIRRS